jgi:UDP-N-acetyl-D-glucosamine dehydrogenase
MSATVGIVGLGYVGLPLGLTFARAGVDVIGVDIDAARVAALRSGHSHIGDVPDAELAAVADRTRFSTRFGDLCVADAILICVPTPLTRNREPDLTPLLSAARNVADVLRTGQLVVLESTTFPGTTREYLVPILEESGLKAGRDFALAFSPERVDPGQVDHTIANTPKVVGGLTADCTARACALYQRVCEQVVPVSTPEVAELTKLLENTFRCVNIALVNELSIVADRMGIDIWEVVDAASTKPFGFMRFEPGPGMGGHCLPVDPFYLSWRAREFDVTTEFIELAGKVNTAMPEVCVQRAERALNDLGRSVRGSTILVVGVSYKPGVGDVRESPALKIVSELLARGAEVVFSDPYVDELPAYGLRHTDLDAALDAEPDLALIVTAHPGVALADVAARVPTVDFRGALRRIAGAPVAVG